MMPALSDHDYPPSAQRPWDARLDWAGRIGLGAFFLFYQLNATVGYVGLALVTGVFFCQARRWAAILKNDWVARLYVVLVLYILGYAAWAVHEFPQTLAAQRVAVFDWMHWLLFIPVAWVLRQQKAYLNTFLLLLAAGVLARILIHVEWGKLATIFSWPRMGFGLTETVFAPLAGISALGLLILGARVSARAAQAGRWWGLALSAAWLAGLAVFLQSLVLSQTRGVWLAAVLVFPLALAARFHDWLRRRAFKSAQNLAGMALALAMLGVFIHLNSTPLASRIQSESLQSHPSVETKAVEGGNTVVVTTGISYRLILWRIGFDNWKQRPFLGWGPGTSEYLVQKADNDLLNQHVTLSDGRELSLHLTHLHSLYLEILVRFGLLGAALFFLPPLLMLRGAKTAYQRGMIPWDYACFIAAGWAFTSLVAFTDFQIFKFAWRNYCVIWAALTYAVYLETIITRDAKAHEKTSAPV